MHVEHIIPQKITTKRSREDFGNWEEYLGERAKRLHPKHVNRIGNLTLFAGELNITASNNPFAAKKAKYKQSSILMTKELAQLNGFKFAQVDSRSKELAKLAVKLWPSG
ncbi:HNH endonuclease family protein [Rhizobium gallicum]|uniref:HNH endonuclease family protein n=1 Tax=Rhizobium gallicum TaxID=56730 RepID=UPI001EF8DB52|nr:HNH endonuclease family protein [Rhizobium gallicum]ULJ74197.1 HNH endonuclease family protein [Rhizobium gallicum]